MNLITLLTDFGEQDGYVGTMKGVILSTNPAARIVDISHQIPVQNIHAGAFVLNSSHRYFPSGTIHVIVVDPDVGSSRRILICQTENYIFLAPDNGILKYIFNQYPDCQVFEVTQTNYFLEQVSNTFQGRDIFAPVAAHLSLNKPIEKFGTEINSFSPGNLPKLLIGKNGIVGEIVYIDHFGNLISNISRQHLDPNLPAERILVRIKNHLIQGILSSYQAGLPNKPFAIWGSTGTLEISINQSRADYELDISFGEDIHLEWSETEKSHLNLL